MKIYKKFARWWDGGYGGEWAHHCDFTMEEGEDLGTILHKLTRDLPKVPPGKQSKVHLHFTYNEEDAE